MEFPKIVRTYIDTFSRQDLDAWFATFAPDGTYSDPATAQPLSGQALKDYFSEFGAGFPDWTCKAVAVHAITEDLAVWRWIMHATHTGSLRGLPPTGRSLSWPGCEFIEVRQGLVQQVEGYHTRKISHLSRVAAMDAPSLHATQGTAGVGRR